MVSKLHLKLKGFLNKLPLFYSFMPQETEAQKLVKKYYNKNLLFNYPLIPKYMILIVSIIVWLFWSVNLSIKHLKKKGKEVKEKFGISLLKQFIELLYYSNFHLIKPRSYYYFSLFKKENKKNASYYLTDRLPPGLFNPLNRSYDLSILNDKLKFFEFCNKHQIPTPPVIAVSSKGKFNYRDNFDDLPKSDLIFKLRNGSATRGFMRWEYTGNDFYKLTNTDNFFLTKDLIDYFIKISQRYDYIVQPRLYDHDAIKELSNGALSTIRMITAINRENKIIELCSMFNIPTVDSALNNLKDGGIACPVDSEKGILKEGITSEIARPLYEINPFNGAKLKGKKLPDWDKCKNIAINAHSKVGKIPFIGWDICITNKGWMILEGNHSISLNFHQLYPNKPFGKTEFIHLLVQAMN